MVGWLGGGEWCSWVAVRANEMHAGRRENGIGEQVIPYRLNNNEKETDTVLRSRPATDRIGVLLSEYLRRDLDPVSVR